MSNDLVVIGNSVELSSIELRTHGCKNCILKLYHQCPYGLTKDEVHDGGYCTALTNFFTNLVSSCDSPTKEELWERYQLYNMKLESMDDFHDLRNLKDEIKTLRDQGVDVKDLEFQLNTLRMWWVKMNDIVIKGFGKIVDRDKAKKIDITHTNLSLDDLHNIMRTEKIVDVEIEDDKRIEG